MMSMKDEFLARLRAIADEWRGGDIDFATFTSGRDRIWDAIRQAGPAVEAAVLQTLRDQLPTSKPGAPIQVVVIKVSQQEKDECYE
jgi:hypothetical protein